MGYESKIYVIQEHGIPHNDEGLPYGEVLAMFDLCKMGYELYNGCSFRDLFSEERTCFFYGDDGNTIIKEDCYGSPIEKARNNLEVIEWLKAMLKDEHYGRAKAFKKYLDALEKEGMEYSLYHFGY